MLVEINCHNTKIQVLDYYPVIQYGLNLGVYFENCKTA
jgi:hypothetical protein